MVMVNKVKMWEVSDQNVDVLVHLHAQHASSYIIEGGHTEDHLNIYNQEILSFFDYSSEEESHQPSENMLQMALQQQQALLAQSQKALHEANQQNEELQQCNEQLSSHFQIAQQTAQKQFDELQQQLQQLKLQHADKVDPSYPIPPQDVIRDATPGDHINALRQEAFDYVPPTVNKKRGCCSL